MLKYPKTLEEARQYRYREWAGNPKGNPYQEGFCAYEVWPNDRGGLPHQCHKKNGYGINSLYCKQHSKILDGIYNMEKKIHQTHFTVPELPYKKMEREAILLFRQILVMLGYPDTMYDPDDIDYKKALEKNKDLVDWVMKYKGK